MTPDEWRERWEVMPPDIPDELRESLADDFALRPFAATDLGDTVLADADRRLLLEAGLPYSAAPFLSFGPVDHHRLPPDFARWPNIGANAHGDPICLEPDGQIVARNHDNGFVATFINSSVTALCQSLLFYRDAAEASRRAGLESPAFEAAALDHARDALVALDPAALEPGTMWAEALRVG